ncbi:MAG: cell division protein ZapB [Spirochaetia bacterium]|nr:cell division protein ZapB [Spirochaetia bacterium]
MISLDQVLLLEKKVESAVAKIQQLQTENDALRKKCDELTNSLSSKSELLSSFESDQNQIENGIKNALDRLSSIENTVIETFSSLSNQKTNIGQVDSINTIQNNNKIINNNISNIEVSNQKAPLNTLPNKNYSPESNLKPHGDISNVKFENMDKLSEQTNNPTLSEDLFNSGSQVFDNVQKNQQEVFHDFQQISEENFSDESDDDLSFDIF